MNARERLRRLLKWVGLADVAKKMICGLRRVLCTRDLWLFYMSVGDLRPYLREFRSQALRYGFRDDNGRKTWCEYLVVLNEIGLTCEFNKAIDRFIAGGTLNVHALARYLPLAAILEQRGIDDPVVKRAASVYRILRDQHLSGVFLDMVKDKTIAVVGNGPSELGKGLGGEIDAHDYVIRINNHTLEGFEKDYGTKADIWVKHTTDYIKHDVPEESIKLIMYASNWMREQMPDAFMDAILHDSKKRLVDFCGIENRVSVSERFMIHPLTGTLVIDMLYRSEMKYADVYGFSFLETDGGGYRHYVNDMSSEKLKKEVGVHNTDLETKYLKSLFGEGRRLYPITKQGDNK